MEVEEEFKIHTYLKADLAHLYNPNMPVVSAMRKLRRWIRRNEDLYDKMYESKEGKNDHTYTRRQVQLIVTYLGPP